jgi:hypothetical protein
MTTEIRESNGSWVAVTPSPDGTIITAPSTAAIVDAAGNNWTIGAQGILAVNGAPDLSTFGVTEIALVGGVIWQFNGVDWYSKAVPQWTEGPGPLGSAVLNWKAPTTNTDGTPITGLSGYVVSYGKVATALTESEPVAAPATSLTIVNLPAGTWFFEVTAVNSAGEQSAPTAQVSKTITIL